MRPSADLESQEEASKSLLSMPPAGFEPTAPGLGILCSIQLSYGGAALLFILSQR